MNPKRKTTCSKKKAFTLLELIVALALMDVIAVALYSSMYIAFKSKKSSHAALAPYQMVTPAFEILRRDLSSALNPDGIMAGVFVGEDVPGTSRLDADTLNFFSCSYRPKDGQVSSNVVKIGYVLESDIQRNQLVLKRLVTTNVLSPTTVEPDEEVICRGIWGLNFEYYSDTTWLDEWDSSAHDGQLPWGIKITLTLFDETEIDSENEGFRHFTRIFLFHTANQESEEVGGEMLEYNG